MWGASEKEVQPEPVLLPSGSPGPKVICKGHPLYCLIDLLQIWAIDPDSYYSRSRRIATLSSEFKLIRF